MPVIDFTPPGPVFPSEEGPCSWTVETSCCPEWDTYTPGVQSAALSWSTFILWSLTGRRYGPCSVNLRPCRQKCQEFTGYLTNPVYAMSGASSTWMFPWIDNGLWRNCGCGASCSCSARCEINLPGPVAFVDQVMIDGAVLDPSAYRLDNGTILVRTDGDCWPECQDMSLANDAVGAFTVTYQKGIPVPRAGEIAAGELACQFAKACAGSNDCALPEQLISLSRNGVEVQVADPQLLLDAGLTGLPNVDLFIRAVNPARLPARPRVYSPDIRQPRQVTP